MKAKPKRVPGPPRTNTLQITREPDKSEEMQLAESLLNPAATSALVAQRFCSQGGTAPNVLGITEAFTVIASASKAVNANDLSGMEAMLTSQVIALNTMFAEFARRASLNLGTHMEATETYTRLALKAQAQCRSTAETLGALKNPPVVYAKQANFAAGHQQVNNGGAPVPHTAQKMAANEILEESRHAEWMDTRAACPASVFDSIVATLGEDHRTKDGSRKACLQPQRVQGREVHGAAGAEPTNSKSAQTT